MIELNKDLERQLPETIQQIRAFIKIQNKK